MCTDCKLILEKHKGAVILAASKEKPFYKKFLDFKTDIMINFFFQKQKDPSKANVSPSYFYKIAKNIKTDFFREMKKHTELTDEHKTYIEEKKVFPEHYEIFIKKIIKFLRESGFTNEEEIEAFLSASKGQPIQEYLKTLDNVMEENSAGTKRRRAITKISEYIKNNPDFKKEAERLNLDER